MRPQVSQSAVAIALARREARTLALAVGRPTAEPSERGSAAAKIGDE